MGSKDEPTTSLTFPFEIIDGWPLVGSECVPFRQRNDCYEVLSAPVFVRELSVGDVIKVDADSEKRVGKWIHISRSDRTTIWLLRLKKKNGIDAALAALRKLNCNTGALEPLGCHPVDVPQSLSITDVDSILDSLDPSEASVAFPSMRHPN